jgi:hypothetical protein
MSGTLIFVRETLRVQREKQKRNNNADTRIQSQDSLCGGICGANSVALGQVRQ